MNWKLFWQIVLLMVVGAVILCALKCGMIHCKRSYMGKCMGEHPHQMERKR